MVNISINGKSYPVKFGFASLKKIMGKYNLTRLVEVEALINTIAIDDLPWILNVGVQNGCKITKDEPISLEEIRLAFEEDISLMTKTMEAFSDNLSGNDEKEEPKKKLTHKP